MIADIGALVPFHIDGEVYRSVACGPSRSSEVKTIPLEKSTPQSHNQMWLNRCRNQRPNHQQLIEHHHSRCPGNRLARGHRQHNSWLPFPHGRLRPLVHLLSSSTTHQIMPRRSRRSSQIIQLSRHGRHEPCRLSKGLLPLRMFSRGFSSQRQRRFPFLISSKNNERDTLSVGEFCKNWSKCSVFNCWVKCPKFIHLNLSFYFNL